MQPPLFLPFAHPAIDEATVVAVADVLRSGWIASGPVVEAFEAQLSALFGGRHVLAFSSGTAALEVALRTAGVGPGDEVITSPITWVATANAIATCGARPVFVDIDPTTRTLDLDAAAAAVGSRTRAIVPVHLAGLPAGLERLHALAHAHGLRVIEDAAQAIDARWGDARVGSFGDLACFSFQANKNITCAEGGCLVLGSPAETERARRLRLQGVVRTGRDGMDVPEPGGKFNLSDVHAAIGLGQLAALEAVTCRRAALAAAYFERAADHGLEALGIELPPRQVAPAVGNWHLFQVLLPVERLQGGRAAVMESLQGAGIGSGVHYPAVHLFTHYRAQGWHPGMLPRAERVGRSILTLPLFTSMTEADVDRTCGSLAQACRELAG